MLSRFPAQRRPKSQKHSAARKRSLRAEVLEERWMLSGQGLLGLSTAVVTASATKASAGPAIVTAATATLASSGKTATLSVTASEAGAASLVYTWSVVAAPASGKATFTSNATTTSNNDTVTFGSAGTYTLSARAADAGGLSATSNVTVTVSQALGGITVTPANAILAVGWCQQYAVAGYDQFGNAMAVTAPITWSSTAGTITASGMFTAPNVSVSTVTITATCGALSGTATAAVSHLPTVTTPLTATVNSTMTGAALSLKATDDAGGSDIIYSWFALSAPTGGYANFSDYNTNTAANTTATFNKAGTYCLEVMIIPHSGPYISKTVSVTVAATPSRIAVTPATAGLGTGSSQQFAASEFDQFGNALAVQPAFSWAASAGTVTSGGRFTAPTVPGIVTMTARSGSVSGTAAITVYDTPKISAAAAATLNKAGTGATLSVAATDGISAANLSYQWSVLSAPAGGTAKFGANASNAAEATTVTFNEAGTYTLQATVTDAIGLSATSNVTVNVAAVATTITVAPVAGPMQFGASAQCSASEADQFGSVLAVQPKFTWSASAGTISGSGLFTAPAASGAVTLTASSGSVSGKVSVAVENTISIVAPAAGTVNSAMTGAALSVTATDYYKGADLVYAWGIVSSPSGGIAAFSSNDCNAAQNTVVTFNEAGTYVLGVKATPTGASLRWSSTVTVVVTSRATSIVVTPNSASLAAGSTQQFAASELDQFGIAIAAQPKFTWSATTGTISSTGLYSAAKTAGSGTVTAQSGSLSGSASVTIAAGGGVLLSLHDQKLAAQLQSLDADGSISRQDMLTIFNSVESSNATLSVNEFADLQTVVADAAILNMPGYVQVLSADVVNGNPGNTTYLNKPLGNLAAGSTTARLTTLVSKWFLGTDHPTPARPYAIPYDTYCTVGGSLFGGGPAYTDVVQGQLGDCYFLSAMGTIAKSSPAAIQNMIIDNGDGTFTVRFYAGTESYTANADGSHTEGFVGTPTADYVTVDRMLPVNAYGTLDFAGQGWSASNAYNKLWVPLVEKAYVQWAATGREWRPMNYTGVNFYGAIEGGLMSDVNCQVLGHASVDYGMTPSNAAQSLIAALAANKAVTIGTVGSPKSDDSLSFGLFGSHAYAVTGYNATTGTFTLYNPWGCDQANPLTWAQLAATCDIFSIADASGTSPLTAAKAATATVAVKQTMRLPSLMALDAFFAASYHDSDTDT